MAASHKTQIYQTEDKVEDELLFDHILFHRVFYDDNSGERAGHTNSDCSQQNRFADESQIRNYSKNDDTSTMSAFTSQDSGHGKLQLDRKRKLAYTDEATSEKQSFLDQAGAESPTLSQMFDRIYSDSSDSDFEPMGERVHLLDFDPPSFEYDSFFDIPLSHDNTTNVIQNMFTE